MTLKIKLFPPTTLRHVSHLSLKKPPDSGYSYFFYYTYKRNTTCNRKKLLPLKLVLLETVPKTSQHNSEITHFPGNPSVAFFSSVVILGAFVNVKMFRIKKNYKVNKL